MSDPTLYSIGWICAISTEQTAARQFLDEQHGQPQYVSKNDNNAYTLGRIGKHNVVIAALPDGEYGECSAATVARDMLSSFPNVRFGLMVGIGGGAPSPKHDIRLGDIVVSSPVGGDGGVFQYDFGKTIQNREFQHTRFLDQPPTILRTTVSSIRSQHEEAGNRIEDAVNAILDQKPRLKTKYKRPEALTDHLYEPSYVHQSNDGSCKEHCGLDPSIIVSRPVRGDDDDSPAIHYGLIASANQVMKDATIRDTLIKEKDVLCFEMEAAGLMNHFPCLIIRGICDYSDSHKNKQWQGYAAMTAAAYAKQVLVNIAPTRVENESKIAEVLKNIEEQVAQVTSLASEMNITAGSLAQDAKFQSMRDWLSPQDASSNHNNAVSMCHKGTGQWFIQGETFAKFKHGTLPILWLNGLPGCGKTILNSSIIEELQHNSSSLSFRVLYFYFDFNDARKQTFGSVLRSLLWQAASYHGYSSKVLEDLYDSCKSGRDQPSVRSLVQSLDKELQLQDTAILIDALDECTARANVLTWLESLIRSKNSIVRMIVTSRKEQDIEAGLEKWLREDAIVAVHEQVVDADINAYVKHRLRTDTQLQRWHGNQKVKDEIESKLMSRAHGTFRWVKCQLDILTECLSYPQLTNALRSLPPTLNATYARMIDQIPRNYREQAIRLLQVLIWSDAPLAIEEAVDFLAVDPESEPGFDVQNRMPVPKEITRLCPGLVTVTTETVDLTKFGCVQPRTRTSLWIRLSHFSVKEYLTSRNIDTEIHPTLSQGTAAERIASVSLAYILTPKPPMWNLNTQDLPLLEFCVREWTKFARLAGCESQTLQRLTMQLFSQPQHFREWSTAFQETTTWFPRYLPGPSAEPLYYASMAGLNYATQALLEAGADVNAPGGDFKNALQAAIVNGHQEVVSMLLDKGADVNSRGYLAKWNERETDVTALYSAVIIGNLEIVELLLRKGADPNFQCGRFGNALQVACNKTSEPIARMLLDHGADINARSPDLDSALQAACKAGHVELTDLLLRRGADLKYHGGECSNAMVSACSNGHLKISAMLIERGADLNACGGFYGNALQSASYLGLEKVVQWLLANGAEVDAKGGCFHRRRVIGSITDALRRKIKHREEWTSPAIHRAAEKGHQHVVLMLLNHGADRSLLNPRGMTALRVAFENGHENVMSLLLETGTNNHAELESEPLMLHLAVQRGQEDIVQLLLDHGAKVDSVDDQHRTALYHAIDHGHQVIAVVLIRKDPNCGAQKIRGRSILDFATERGQIYILQLLLGERRC